MKDTSKTTNSGSRRQFLCHTAALATAVAVGTPRAARGANECLGIGFIGTGGRASAHIKMTNFLKTERDQALQLVAFCDAYRPRREKWAKQFQAKAYEDYRDLLKDPNVDVVCIATPDHHHGYQAIDAVRAGKAVYCEKPVVHWRQFDLIKQLAAEVKKSGRPFQLGTQLMSDSIWRQMKKLVQEDGIIGQPLSGETGYFRVGDWGERGMNVPDPNVKPGKDLNWELFLGDATKRPFSVDRYFRWRLFEDYAGGPVTDLYPHVVTQVVDILGVKFPKTVVATGGIHRYDYELREVPDTFNLLAQYPEKVTLSLLGTQANDYCSTGRRSQSQIPVIRGWDGTLTINRDNKHLDFTPTKGAKGKRQQFPVQGGENNLDHWQNLIDCVRSGGTTNTWSGAELAYHVQTMLIMGMWCHKQDKIAHFDAKAQKIVMG